MRRPTRAIEHSRAAWRLPVESASGSYRRTSHPAAIGRQRKTENLVGCPHSRRALSYGSPASLALSPYDDYGISRLATGEVGNALVCKLRGRGHDGFIGVWLFDLANRRENLERCCKFRELFGIPAWNRDSLVTTVSVGHEFEAGSIIDAADDDNCLFLQGCRFR